MASVCSAERVPGVEQIFYKKGENGRTELLFAKVVEAFLIARFPNAIASFTTALGQRFQLERVETEPNLKFFGIHISKDIARDFQLFITDYHKCINPVQILKRDITMQRRKRLMSKMTHFVLLLKVLLYMG